VTGLEQARREEQARRHNSLVICEVEMRDSQIECRPQDFALLFDGRRVAKAMPQSNDKADKLSPLRPQTQ